MNEEKIETCLALANAIELGEMILRKVLGNESFDEADKEAFVAAFNYELQEMKHVK